MSHVSLTAALRWRASFGLAQLLRVKAATVETCGALAQTWQVWRKRNGEEDRAMKDFMLLSRLYEGKLSEGWNESIGEPLAVCRLYIYMYMYHIV